MKIRKLLFTFALLFSASIFAQSPANGGFENGVINAVTDWAAPLVSGTSSVTTTNARTGSYALAVTTNSNAPSQDNINATIISVPDTWYGHAIGWVRGSDANSRAQMRGTLNVTNVGSGVTLAGALNNILSAPYTFNSNPVEYTKAPAFIAHYIYQSEESYINRKINLPRDDNGSGREKIDVDHLHSMHNSNENTFPKLKYAKNVRRFLRQYGHTF
jgi:hypothetical protein